MLIYILMRNTMSSPKSSWKGRTMNTESRSDTGRVSRSCSVTYSALPVSRRSLRARLARIVGAKVSGTVKVMRTQTMTARISWIQYSQRQPAASERKPPTRGPTAKEETITN